MYHGYRRQMFIHSCTTLNHIADTEKHPCHDETGLFSELTLTYIVVKVLWVHYSVVWNTSYRLS